MILPEEDNSIPSLGKGIPAHDGEIGNVWSLKSLPTQIILRFYGDILRFYKAVKLRNEQS